MTVTLELVNLVQLQFVVLALLGIVLVRQGSRFRMLSLILGLQAALMTFNLLEETGVTRVIHLVTPIFTLSFGPAIYLFVRQVVYGSGADHRPLGWHFLPMLLALPLTQWPQFVIALGSVSQVLYLLISMHMLWRYHEVALQARSDAHDLRLTWLLLVLGAYLVTMVQDLVRQNLQPFAPLGLLQWWYLLNTAIYLGLSIYLVVKAVRQPALFEHFSELQSLEQPSASTRDAEAATIFAQIDTVIRDGALYQQPRLSLRNVATAVGLDDKTVSWAINRGAGRSFCDYVNHLRVEALRSELERQGLQHQTLLDAALAVGFSAKSTFNTVFKKETGVTPSQYLRNVQSMPTLGSES